MPNESNNQYSHERLLAGVLSELLNPASGMNHIADIYERMLGRIQHYSTFVQTLGGNWLLDRTRLSIGPGKVQYEITDANFAQALLIETHPNDLPQMARPARIECVGLEDLHNYSNERIQAFFGSNSATVPTVPRAVATWVEQGQTFLRVCAEPLTPISLQIFFEPATTFQLNPKAVPNFLPQFFELLQMATALRVLPLFKKEMDAETYAELTGSLRAHVSESEMLLRQYASNDHNETSGHMRGWGANRR